MPTSDQADQHYDLIIVGTGSGNSIPGPEFDDQRIAIVEEGRFGGTCLNVGCIPTKMFVYTAEVARTIREAQRYGITANIEGIDWPSIVERVFGKRIDPIAEGGEAYRRGPETPNIDVYDGHARFVGPRTLRTSVGGVDTTISGNTIVLATGARPLIPRQIEESGVDYYTNETIMRMPSLPSSMVIYGGGYIAMEFAHLFHALGVQVKVVNRSNTLLRHLDADLAQAFTQRTVESLETHLGSDVASASSSDGTVTLTLENDTKVSGEVLLVATGRVPNGDRMDLEQGGVDHERGKIRVDEFGRTTAQGVWALGDVSSPYMLKHVANAEMRAVKHNLLHPEDLRPMPHEHVPAAVFTHPQIASVGMTEQEAIDAGHQVTVKVQRYGDVAYGWAMEDEDSFIKVIADRSTRRLLGAHLIGPQASTLVQQLITVMAFDLDVAKVSTDQYWIHPALPELIENALLGLEFDDPAPTSETA